MVALGANLARWGHHDHDGVPWRGLAEVTRQALARAARWAELVGTVAGLARLPSCFRKAVAGVGVWKCFGGLGLEFAGRA